MKLLLVLIFALLLLPAIVGSAAASVAAALPAAPPSPLFAWVPQSGYPDPFPYGECTWWVAYNHKVTWGGDAWDWITNARAQGVMTTETPSVGAIVVYRPGGAYSELGHVAIVTEVTGDTYRVSEMHAPRWGVVSTRLLPWPDSDVIGFIRASDP
jgi:surface antigen